MVARTRSMSLTEVTTTTPEGEKLHKVLATAGIASRRRCEEMIAAGRRAGGRRTRRTGATGGPRRRRDRRGRGGGLGRPRPGPLPAQQAARRGEHRRRRTRQTHGRVDGADRTAGLPRRPARPRQRGVDPAHERRIAHPPADPPVLRGSQGVPRGVHRPDHTGRAPRAARRRRPRRRSDCTCTSVAPCRASLADRHPRRPQPPGASHGRRSGRRRHASWCARESGP